jgi:RNA polymerase sigma factor (sigma-70 family)
MIDLSKLSFGKLVDLYSKDLNQEDIRAEIYSRLDTQAFESLGQWFVLYQDKYQDKIDGGYEQLVRAIFGSVTVEDLLKGEIHRVAKDQIDPVRSKSEFGLNVFLITAARIFNGQLSHPVSPAEARMVDDILKTLTQNEERVIKMRYGLKTAKCTLSEIGSKYGISNERVRQIQLKALRKLRNPKRSQDMKKMFLRPMKDRLFEANTCLAAMCAPEANIGEQAQLLKDVPYVRNLIETFTAQVDRLKAENIELRLKLEGKDSVAELDFLDLSIDGLELSVRAYNCLLNAGTRTVRDITSKTRREILDTPNLGIKSFTEILDILQENGLDFAI